MADKKEKDKLAFVIITEKESDLLNGLMNNLILFAESTKKFDTKLGTTSIKSFLRIMKDPRMETVMKKFNEARHKAGFCKDPSCSRHKHKSKRPFKN